MSGKKSFYGSKDTNYFFVEVCFARILKNIGRKTKKSDSSSFRPTRFLLQGFTLFALPMIWLT